MKTPNRLVTRLLNFTFRHRNDERLREEIECHIEALTEDYICSGMSPEEAHRQAKLKFGSIETIREDYHSEKGLPFLETLLLDIRYALRVLRKSPSFTIVAFITLMFGIGANIIVFGVLNAIVLRPLAVKNPENLYQIRPKTRVSGRLLTTSYPAFEDIRQRNTTFSDIAGFYGYSNAGLSWHGNAIKALSGYEVTGNYFDLLGVQAEAGHFFHLDDVHGAGSAPYVVLSDALWRNIFQADPGVIGTSVELNNQPFTVIGVAPAEFQGTEKFRRPDYWIPMANGDQVDGWDHLHNRASTTVTVIGRLRSGVTQQQATENLNAIAAELAKEYPLTDKGQDMRLIHPGLMGDDGEAIRGFLFGLTALVLLVLAAACTNLASLFAARAADRSRELALRVALGSSRSRLIRQLITESILVSLIGGAAGLVCAYLLLRMLDHWSFLGQHPPINLDARVYLAALIFTLGSGLLIGMIPARQAWRSSPLQTMKNGTEESLHLRRFALRDLLLGLQISICTLLVTASLVAARGIVRALQAPLGVEIQGVMLAHMDLKQAKQTDDAALEKQQELIEAARNIPGVTAVGIINSQVIGGGAKGLPIFRPGTTEFILTNSVLESRLYASSPGYMKAAGTRLLSGRDFSWHDAADAPAVAIVNETFAQKMWSKTSAIGQHFYLKDKLMEVVGVTETGKYHDLAESPMPAMYVPLAQNKDSEMTLVVRSKLASNEIAAALRRTLGSVEPNVPLTLRSWTDELDWLLFPARTTTVSLGILGALAAMLAVTGIFGMAAYSVSRRMKELGIRMALGARKAHVIYAALGRPLILLIMGSMLGLLAAITTNHLMQKIVYQANTWDPIVLFGTILTMIALGLVASAIPIRRALALNLSKLIRED